MASAPQDDGKKEAVAQDESRFGCLELGGRELWEGFAPVGT